MAKLEQANLPIVDFAKITGAKTAEETKREKHELYRALKDVGFVYLKHPGVSQGTVDTLFSHTKRFFDKPESEKVALLGRADRPGGPSQGWSSPARRAANPATSDIKEFLGIYRDDNPAKPNQWPEDSPELRRDVNSFFDTCHETILTLLAVLAEEIGLDADTFAPFISDKNHFCAMLYYPSTPIDSFKNRVRAGTHTDYGCMTLLFNDDGEGLQVCDRNGEFQYAPRMADCAIVNVGDLLSRLFNGNLQSTKHRVIEPPPQPSAEGQVIPARYSIAFFGHLNPDLLVEPLAACCTDDNPQQFEPVVAGAHVKARVQQLHTAGHSVAQTV